MTKYKAQLKRVVEVVGYWYYPGVFPREPYVYASITCDKNQIRTLVQTPQPPLCCL